ncbi:hypothetical protein DSO57_1007023 [Entomophthora muscae]|uniref:Uncharacterized protein n=1 Tax=Entomophthora muscae TaxID=34485 RepID=A0ACC2RM77_9FUNG|nr:hypothetical protein DSO57_1007023 [Entomophthora muscae]
MLDNLHFTIQGPVIDFPKFNIVLGLDGLQRNNPHVDWATSALTIKCEGVNHNVVNATIHHVLILPLVGHFKDKYIVLAFAS